MQRLTQNNIPKTTTVTIQDRSQSMNSTKIKVLLFPDRNSVCSAHNLLYMTLNLGRTK